jgi:hypothetical protein
MRDGFRMRDGDVGVIAASFTSATEFPRTSTAKEAGSAHAYAIDCNK